MDSGASPGEVVFGIVSGENVELCPRWGGLSSSCLSPVGAIIGVLGGGLSSLCYCLVCLLLCRARSLSFLLGLGRMAALLAGSWSFCSLSVLSANVLLCFMYFLPTRCLCWYFKFNCIDSWSLYSYFTCPGKAMDFAIMARVRNLRYRKVFDSSANNYYNYFNASVSCNMLFVNS